jgi:Transglycosylase SLT domain
MRCVRSLIIVLLANQAAIAAATAGERTILRAPAAIFGQKHSVQQATQDTRITLVKPLDRVATAVDGAESSHGKDIAMWRPDPSGPQGPMQVSEAAATDVGGGDRFDLTQNRALGRAYLAQLYGRYKNWPDAIAAYNWGPRNVDTWVKAGRPPEKLLAGVAAYTTRVLYESGLCYGFESIRLRRSAIFDGDPEFRAGMADPLTHSIFGHFDADGGGFTRGQRSLCGTVPNSFSRVGPPRMKQAGAPPRSLFEQMKASARLSWRRATQRHVTQA